MSWRPRWGPSCVATLLVLYMCFAGACSRWAVPDPGLPVEDPALARSLREGLDRLYPKELRALHRVILEVRARQYDLLGYVLCRGRTELRLVGMSDLGGTLFDLVHSPAAGSRVLRNGLGLDTEWLVEGAARDALLLYLERPAADSRLVRHRDGSLGLVARLPDGSVEEYLFDAPGRSWTAYRRSRRGRPVYEMRLFSLGPLPGWAGPTARRVEIRDHRLGYQASIRVVKLDAMALKDEHFSGED